MVSAVPDIRFSLRPQDSKSVAVYQHFMRQTIVSLIFFSQLIERTGG